VSVVYIYINLVQSSTFTLFIFIYHTQYVLFLALSLVLLHIEGPCSICYIQILQLYLLDRITILKIFYTQDIDRLCIAILMRYDLWISGERMSRIVTQNCLIAKGSSKRPLDFKFDILIFSFLCKHAAKDCVIFKRRLNIFLAYCKSSLTCCS
jgi:hypothetical protein